MSERVAPRGIVIGHAGMAEGLVDAVRRIAGGKADALSPLSNEGKAPEELIAAIDRIAEGDPVVVFVDLQAGSCGRAALTSCRGKTLRAVVCGVNLPMLLDFVFHRELPLEELVTRLLAKGRDAVTSSLPAD